MLRTWNHKTSSMKQPKLFHDPRMMRVLFIYFYFYFYFLEGEISLETGN